MTIRKPIIIGKLTITEPREHTIDFETASWYQKIRIEPGTYPVHAYAAPGCYPNFDGKGQLQGSSVYVHVSGVCVSSYFCDRIGQHRSSKVNEDVGKTLSDSLMINNYGRQLTESIADGSLELDDSIVYVETVEPSSGGEPFGILRFRAEAPIAYLQIKNKLSTVTLALKEMLESDLSEWKVWKMRQLQGEIQGEAQRAKYLKNQHHAIEILEATRDLTRMITDTANAYRSARCAPAPGTAPNTLTTHT